MFRGCGRSLFGVRQRAAQVPMPIPCEKSMCSTGRPPVRLIFIPVARATRDRPPAYAYYLAIAIGPQVAGDIQPGAGGLAFMNVERTVR